MATSTTLPSRYAIPLVMAAPFCAAAFGYAACLLGGWLPPVPLAWLVFAVVAALVACVAAAGIGAIARASQRTAAAELEGLRAQASAAESLRTELAGRVDQQRRLRHDLRGALSPVMLIADRLVSHADPAVKRSGDILLRTVERATDLLAEPSPPAGP